MAHSLRRIGFVWLLLVAATLFSFGTSGVADRRLIGAVVILVALVKVWIVGREFMELRGAPRSMRLMFDGWTVLLCAVLLALILGGLSV